MRNGLGNISNQYMSILISKNYLNTHPDHAKGLEDVAAAY
jgi:hypothetical protein